MDVITALTARVSCPKLREPGPDDAALDTLFRCALRAPDHGLLRPWRYVLFRGAARQELGELFGAAEWARNPAASADSLDKLRRNPLRAPVVIACIAVVDPLHPKIPALEQIASMAAAVQNLQLAAEALGFAAMWRTGPMTGNAMVKQALGARPADEIVAFLYIGTADGERRRPEELAPADFVREWPLA